MAAWEAGRRRDHGLLYPFFAQPLIGIAHSGAANFPVVVFGSFTLPALIGLDEALKKTLEDAHEWASIILFLVLLHIAAALRHHFVIKDDVLRMPAFGGRGRAHGG